jgi:putative ATPase
MAATLFDEGSGPERPGAPLAVRMRPRTIDDLVGQRHLIAEGSPLRRLLEGDPAAAVSLILPLRIILS